MNPIKISVFAMMSAFLVFGAAPAHAKEKHEAMHAHHHERLEANADDKAQGEKQIESIPGQVILHVKGIVCSFCAYGVSKKLSKLDFVDRSKGANKGVTTDIKEGLVTVHLLPEKEVDLEAMKHAVEAGGYELIQIITHDKEQIGGRDDEMV